MVNREKVEDFCKAAEKEEQAAVDIVVVFDEGEIIQYHLAVSYTHLDVYKRQGFGTGIRIIYQWKSGRICA